MLTRFTESVTRTFAAGAMGLVIVGMTLEPGVPVLAQSSGALSGSPSSTGRYELMQELSKAVRGTRDLVNDNRMPLERMKADVIASTEVLAEMKAALEAVYADPNASAEDRNWPRRDYFEALNIYTDRAIRYAEAQEKYLVGLAERLTRVTALSNTWIEEARSIEVEGKAVPSVVVESRRLAQIGLNIGRTVEVLGNAAVGVGWADTATQRDLESAKRYLESLRRNLRNMAEVGRRRTENTAKRVLQVHDKADQQRLQALEQIALLRYKMRVLREELLLTLLDSFGDDIQQLLALDWEIGDPTIIEFYPVVPEVVLTDPSSADESSEYGTYDGLARGWPTE